MKPRLLRHVRIGLALLLTVALEGCLTPPDSHVMSAASSGSAKRNPYSLSVQTRGGTDMGILAVSDISDTSLRVAIETAVRRTALFRKIDNDGSADYELDVTLVELTRPSFERPFTVDMETVWLLTRVSDGAVVLRRSVMSSQTIPESASLVGAVRHRYAIEGAARRNIQQGLEAIAALDF